MMSEPRADILHHSALSVAGQETLHLRPQLWLRVATLTGCVGRVTLEVVLAMCALKQLVITATIVSDMLRFVVPLRC